MANKSDREAAEAYRARLKAQRCYSAKDRNRVAASGAPQRDHAAAAVLHVVFERWNGGCPVAGKILGRALRALVSDGYARKPTETRLLVMAKQPRRKLTPPKPRGMDRPE